MGSVLPTPDRLLRMAVWTALIRPIDYSRFLSPHIRGSPILGKHSKISSPGSKNCSATLRLRTSGRKKSFRLAGRIISRPGSTPSSIPLRFYGSAPVSKPSPSPWSRRWRSLRASRKGHGKANFSSDGREDMICSTSPPTLPGHGRTTGVCGADMEISDHQRFHGDIAQEYRTASRRRGSRRKHKARGQVRRSAMHRWARPTGPG
jgi:hypothetical protein